MRYAVKKFERRAGPGERSKMEGLQQEIAVLMGVSHPNLLCLKDTFDEEDGVYLVLELAPEGELFNWIVMKQKLTEAEARKVFVQLFQSVKYLVKLPRQFTGFRCCALHANCVFQSTNEILYIETSNLKTFSLQTSN
jgi:serine/threonine protein kinase